jgi:hypothetical protein
MTRPEPVSDPQRAARLLELIAAQPAEWQTRKVAAGELSWQEIQDNLRRQADADDTLVDVYHLRPGVGRDMYLIVNADWEHTVEQHMREFVREVITEVAKSAVDASLGIPLLGLLDLPTDATSALLYAIGLHGLVG